MARRKKASRSLSTPNPNPNPNPNPRDFVNLENDLYREASNLSAATGANIAVICRRPSGELRLWGYPSAQAVIDRYQRLSGRRIPEESPAAAPAAELRRREAELDESLPSVSTSADRIAREREWMMESLAREIEGVRKLIAEVIAKRAGAQSLAEGSAEETGV